MDAKNKLFLMLLLIFDYNVGFCRCSYGVNILQILLFLNNKGLKTILYARRHFLIISLVQNITNGASHFFVKIVSEIVVKSLERTEIV